MNKLIKANPLDNVATLTVEMKAGDNIEFEGMMYRLSQDIPAFHKIALTNITAGESVTKYGEPIGTAVQDIAQGDYVHIHNVESNRGRGDKEGGVI